jgi:CDP-ribitol ribitolphosphotransferase
MPLDFQLLKDELEKRYLNIQAVFLHKKLNKTLIGILNYPFHMLRQMYHMASSKVVILDSYSIAASTLHHKQDLQIIQIWHSIGTMKKFGYTAIGLDEGSDDGVAEAMKMHNNYDYIFAASSSYAKDLAAGFGYDENKVIIRPLPRIDLLLDEDYAARIEDTIFSIYPQLKHKEKIVYCPTFRKDESQHQRAVDALIQAVDTNEYNLIIKLHPLSQVKVNSDEVFTLSEFSSFEALFIADYVISDYSCIVYEAGIRDIPLFFYTFDFEYYEVGRGMALDLRVESPSPITEDPTEIIRQIKARGYDMNKHQNFIHKYIEVHNDNAKAIIDFVLSLM